MKYTSRVGKSLVYGRGDSWSVCYCCTWCSIYGSSYGAAYGSSYGKLRSNLPYSLLSV